MEQKIMEFSVDMPEEDGIVRAASGAEYYTQTVIEAIDEFNKLCPKTGGLLVRDHIGHIKEKTHITHSLKYSDGKLIAEIEPLIEGLEDAKIKPIIRIPLRFESGIQTERVLGITNVFLEH